VEDVSRNADARLDTDEMYGSFAAGGTLLYLTVPVLIEIAHPHLIGVAEAQA
jgi:hypothetical protein